MNRNDSATRLTALQPQNRMCRSLCGATLFPKEYHKEIQAAPGVLRGTLMPGISKGSSPSILRRTVWNRSGGGHGKLIRSRRRKGHLGKGQQVHEARVVLPMATVCSSFGDLSDPNDNVGRQDRETLNNPKY